MKRSVSMTIVLPNPPTNHKYQRLAEQLRDQIQKGELNPGDQLPSLVELRSRYGVTQPTVERAYSLLESDGLIVRQPRRGIFVADPTRSPNTASDSEASRTLIAIAEPDYAFFDHCVNRLFSQAEAENLQLLCYPVNSSQKIGSALLPAASHRKAFGYILFRHFLTPLAQELQDAGSRVVMVGAPPPDTLPGVPNVYGDQEQGGYIAVRHLIETGHRFIALHETQLPQRGWGYQRAIREAQRNGINVRETILTDQEMESWRHDPIRCAAFFRHSEAPTCVAVWNDHTAVKLLSWLTRAGVSVPGEVSLVGYDALPEGSDCYPPLTTIDSALEAQLHAAIQLLLQPEPPSPSHTVRVTPTLLSRESVAAPIRIP